jgi:hypothetical protein
VRKAGKRGLTNRQGNGKERRRAGEREGRGQIKISLCLTLSWFGLRIYCAILKKSRRFVALARTAAQQAKPRPSMIPGDERRRARSRRGMDGSSGRGKAGVGDCSLTTVDNQMGLTIGCCTIIIQRERGTTILGTAGKAGQSKANIYGDRIGCSWRLYPSQSALMILTCCRAARPPACDCPQGGGSSVLCAGVVCLVFASQ